MGKYVMINRKLQKAKIKFNINPMPKVPLKPYPRNPNYLVSEDGRFIYSLMSKRIMKHQRNIDGYHTVDIQQRHTRVHRMVYETWVGLIPDGMQINHIDDNKDNNHYSNLYIGTQKENIADQFKNKHRVGTKTVLIVKERSTGKTLVFIPASKISDYSNIKYKYPTMNLFIKEDFINRFEKN